MCKDLTPRIYHEISFDNYPQRIKISNKRKAKFYTHEKQIKSKKYKDRSKYDFKGPGGKLIDLETNAVVIANPKSVGTARYKKITSQALYNRQTDPFTGGKIMHLLKTEFCKKLKDIPPIDVPVKITIELYEYPRVNEQRWDLENKLTVYAKAFNDALTGYKVKGVNTITPILEDDDVFHITSYMHRFIPIEENEEPKMVFIIEEETDKRSLKHI